MQSSSTRAPLTYSQLAHWQLYHCTDGYGSRNVVSATRLRGRLNLDALQRSITEVARRHDALRTRIVVDERGVTWQEIDPPGDCDLLVDDLAVPSAEQGEREIMRRIESIVLDRIDLSAGPLFGARILKVAEAEHVLIVAVEHIVSDGASLDVLHREIAAAYAQLSKGVALSLPPVPLQFPDYAVWQQNTRSAWLDRHDPYWKAHLQGCGRVSLPESDVVSDRHRTGWGVIPLRIGGRATTRLREWCRSRRTSLALSLFTVYAALVLRSCGISEAVIRFQSNGRIHPIAAEAVGFFASRLYLRISLLKTDSFIALLGRVTAEYCRAYQHDDSSYLETRAPRPEFARNTFFNWMPRGEGTTVIWEREWSDPISAEPILFVNPWFKALEWDNEPMVLLHELEKEITGWIYFPLQRISVRTMQRFNTNFSALIEKMLSQPEAPVTDIPLI